MSLNKFMHPRNRYKNAKPSFLHLALKYEEFRSHTTQDDNGKVFLDFKNADALRALTICLLKEDFDLTVELPVDRLVPTLPLRLNYIHWLEDIIGTGEGKWGVDIGTGASCIYPLLAAKMNKWHFLATEADAENAFHATKNVEANGLHHLIHVKQVPSEDALISPLETFTDTQKYDFCMCNPPFFADHMEAQAITNTRSLDRPEAGSVSTASPQESIAQGGEVGFIRQLIEESVVLQDKIRVYTSMVGKKASLGHLKEELRHQKVAYFSTTEFCQGKTMRWGIAWSFDSTVTFPKSHFDSRKEKPPLQYMIPQGAGGVEYKVHEMAAYLQGLLESIKVHCYQGKKAKNYTSLTLTAVENTWCHQRRFRRQQQRQQERHDNQTPSSGQEDSPAKLVQSAGNETETAPCTNLSSSINLNGKNQPDEVQEKRDSTFRKRSHDGTTDNSLTKRVKKDGDDNATDHGINEVENCNLELTLTTAQPQDKEINFSSTKQESLKEGDATNEGESSGLHTDTSPKEYILKCVMRLKRVDEQVQLELEWLDGRSRELLHQIMTFLKNKLAQGKK